MKAVVMTQPGSSDNLKLQEVPKPKIQHANDVLVQIKAAGVNPVDTKLRSRGTYYPDKLPCILGCDGAGIVLETGEEVEHVRPGDEVFYCYGGIGGHAGNYAQYNVLPAFVLAKKPTAIDFSQAAALPLVVITAWEALYDRANIQEQQTVLIHAGAGGVGHIAIQLAKITGCNVITTVSDDAKASLASELGANTVIHYRTQDFVQQVLQHYPEGIDVVLDTVGGATMNDSLAVLKPYGKLVTLLQPEAELNWKKARLHNLSLHTELMLSPMLYNWQDALIHQREILEQSARFMLDGRLQIKIQECFDLAKASHAHRLLECGGVTGKLVLNIA